MYIIENKKFDKELYGVKPGEQSYFEVLLGILKVTQIKDLTIEKAEALLTFVKELGKAVEEGKETLEVEDNVGDAIKDVVMSGWKPVYLNEYYHEFRMYFKDLESEAVDG